MSKEPFSRRDFLATLSVAIPAAALAEPEGVQRQKLRQPLGLVLESYHLRSRAEREAGFTDPLKFLDFCHERGAAGVQLPIGIRDGGSLGKIRETLNDYGMYLEGSIRPPKDKADAERFEEEMRCAKESGATVVRTVMLGGRRYEVFKKAEEYPAFKERAWNSLQLAEPIVAKLKMRLAVENHKDYRTAELVDVMRRLGSEYVGVTVDTGNNIALLDDPMETVKALAPYAFTCHLKDMAVEERADGFLMAEVPLGTGFIDVPAIVETLRKANPKIRLNLEMMTRDPLVIPCLTDGYWATFADVPGRDLARTLAMVRKHARKEPLPKITSLRQKEQLEAEESNVLESFRYARSHLTKKAG
jgi:sugar phosphate isomerase/epimerase